MVRCYWSANQTYSQLFGFDVIPDMSGDPDIRPSEQEIKLSCSDGLISTLISRFMQRGYTDLLFRVTLV